MPQRKIGFRAKKNVKNNKNNIKNIENEDTSSKSESTDSDFKIVNSPVKTPLTPSTSLALLKISSPASIQISSARKAFHSSDKGLVCREEEINTLQSFLLDHLNDQTSASMYISGLPGTGKTASISQVLDNEKIIKGFHKVYINCTAVQSAGAIYVRICEALKIKLAGKSEKVAASAIEKYLSRKHKMVLLIFDEMDQLECRFQTVLYTIFEWPARKNSRIVLVGIANAVDLTDRMLPRLCASSIQPVLLHFRPYTKDQIVKILRHRLAEAEGLVFAPGALELISAKVAVQSGDLRRALDLARRVLDVAHAADTKSEVELRTPTSLKFSRKLTFADDNEDISKSPRKCLTECNASDPRRNLGLNSPRKSPRKSIAQELLLEKQDCGGPLKNVDKTPTKRKLDGTVVMPPGNSESATKNTPKSTNFQVRVSPRKPARAHLTFDSSTESFPRIIEKESVTESPSKLQELRRSPRKLSKTEEVETFSIRARDVASVVNQTYGSGLNMGKQVAMPLHQKLLVCCLLLIIGKARNKDVTVGKVHPIYSRICSKRGITAVDQSGFIFLCRQLEMSGALLLGQGPPRLAKITLQWDEDEIAHAIQDSALLASISNDPSCLGKNC